MNEFREKGLDEDAFGEKGNIVAAFDAFREFHLVSLASLVVLKADSVMIIYR